MYITDILFITLGIQLFIFVCLFILSITTRLSIRKINKKLKIYEEGIYDVMQENIKLERNIMELENGCKIRKKINRPS